MMNRKTSRAVTQRRFCRLKRFLLAVCGWPLVWALSLGAQTPTGQLTGTVKDPVGAAIIGATLTLTKVDVGFARTAQTSAEGKYLFSFLAPGEYEVRVSQAGFAAQARLVTINVGLTFALDFILAIESAAANIQVSAEAALIDTVDQAVKAQVTSNVVKDLPLNGRNFLDLAIVAPGATPVTGDSFDPTKGGYSGVSIAGQAGRSTRIALDGGDINDEVVGTTVQNFSPEIIQEFQISTSSFELSTGATSSGTVNIITRSGQNKLHGAGYLYFRHSQLAAYPGLGGKRGKFKPQFDREQGGAWLSGPLKRDRAFWFLNFEQNNQDQQTFITTGLPAGNPFDGARAQPFDERTFTLKLDLKARDRHQTFARWSWNDNGYTTFFPSGQGIGQAPPGCALCTDNAGRIRNLANQVVAGLTSIISPTLVNDLRGNVSTYGSRSLPLGTGPEIRIRNTNFKIGTSRIFPQTTFQNRWQVRDDLSWQTGKHTIKAGLHWQRTEIFGSIQFWDPADIQLHDFRDVGRSFPASDAELLSWPVRFLRVGVGDPALPTNNSGANTNNDRYFFYVEDSFKPGARLTLNYGVNYRFDTNLVNYDQPKPAILAQVFNGDLSPTRRDKNNVGGRVGFAWDLTGQGRTVVRGGWGLYYDTIIDTLRHFERGHLGPAGSGYLLFNIFQIRFPTFPGDGDNFFAVGDNYTLGNALRDLPAIRAMLEPRPDPARTNIDVNRTAAIVDTRLPIPYANHFNVSVQHKVPWDLIFTSDFLYRQTVRETVIVDANHFAAAIGPVDRALGPITLFKAIGKSKYRAGNFRLERRFTRSLGLTATYVYSRFEALNNDGLGIGEFAYNNLDINESFGPAAQDRPHRFTLTGIWDVPNYQGPRGWGRFWLRDWRIGFISTHVSGPPLTVFIDRVSLTGSDPSQPNLLPGAGFGAINRSVNSMAALNRLITQWNETKAGQRDAFGRGLPTLALLPTEDTIRLGDSRLSHDLRLTKSFRLREPAQLDLITEIFNLFNIANLTGYNVNPLLPTTAACGGPSCSSVRIKQLGFLQPTERTTSVFGYGGPRAFQLALRLTF